MCLFPYISSLFIIFLKKWTCVRQLQPFVSKIHFVIQVKLSPSAQTTASHSDKGSLITQILSRVVHVLKEAKIAIINGNGLWYVLHLEVIIPRLEVICCHSLQGN